MTYFLSVLSSHVNNDTNFVKLPKLTHHNFIGFLNLNMEECSGNQCIKDIILAFQWVRENIHAFNGDPNNITAVGSSGGALVLHLLLLSPTVEGIFTVV